MFQTYFLVWNIIPKGPREVIPKLLSHYDFGPVSPHDLFSVVKTKSSLSKMFSDLSYIQYSRSDISFSAFVRLERSKTPLCIELCGKQYFRVYFRSLLCGRKANLDCLKWSVLDYSCRPNIKDISLFQKQLTIPKYLDSIYQNNRFRSVFKSFNPFRSPQDNAFAIPMDWR